MKTHLFSIPFLLIAVLFSAQDGVGKTTRYWAATSNNAQWASQSSWSSTPGGHSGASVPGTNDIAIFDNNSANCVINEPIKVSRIETKTGYTGSITQHSSIYCKEAMEFNGGSFTGDGYNIITGDLVISGASFTSTDGALLISGSFRFSSGVFNANNGTVIFNGNATQHVFNNGSAVLYDVTVNNSGDVSIDQGNNLGVAGTLRIVSGKMNTNGRLTLVATAAGTGRIAEIEDGDLTGEVTVQQYIPAGRKGMQELGHPFSGTLQLNSLTDNIDITGPGGTANGFKAGTPSAFHYNPLNGNGSPIHDTTGWQPFTSASDVWQPGEGIRVLMKGQRNGNGVTIDETGKINKGDVKVTLRKGQRSAYNVVGNPYPSAIDIGSLLYIAKLEGRIAGGAYWILDETEQTEGTLVPIPINGNPYYLRPGSAFGVNAAADNATLVFHESNKVANGIVSPYTTPGNYVYLHLSDSTGASWDRLYLQFSRESAAISEETNDAPKIHNSALDFYSWSADHKQLSVDSRPLVDGEIIPLGILSAVKKSFVIKVENFVVPAGAQLYLHDKYTGKYQPLVQGTQYSFSINSDSASQGNNRFEINVHNTVTGIAATDANAFSATLAPNPSSGAVSITYTAPGEAQTSVRVLNVSGIEVLKRDLGMRKGGTVKLPMDDFPSGLYIIELTSGNKTITQRLVKE